MRDVAALFGELLQENPVPEFAMLEKLLISAMLIMVGVSAPIAWAVVSTPPESSTPTIPTATPTVTERDLFDGGTTSLVACTIGAAEGTRSSGGCRKNKAYFGHVDPGNGIWNVGTFSYQHCPKCSPEEADRRQLARLRKQYKVLTKQARKKGLNLSLIQKLNGLDLTNQAPLAGLSRGGFVDRMIECKGDLLCARERSYIDPDTGLYDAPGLGNTKSRIQRDQLRRMRAVKAACKSKGRCP